LAEKTVRLDIRRQNNPNSEPYQEQFELLDGVYSHPALALQPERDRNSCFRFHRLPVKKIRFIPPLLDGVDRSGRQHRVPTHELKTLNDSVFVDNRREYDNALDVGLLRYRRVLRFNPVDEQALGNTLRHTHPLRDRSFGFRDHCQF